VHGDGLESAFVAAADHAGRDLAAVGYQDAPEGSRSHARGYHDACRRPMLHLLPAAFAAPAPSPDGATVLAPCLDDTTCDGEWRPLLAETLLESGYTLIHEPVITSALGGKGAGLVVELEVGSAPLGPRNELQALFPNVPALPTVAVGYHVGSYTYETPYPQVTVGLHGLAPVRVGDVSLWSGGATASAAAPLSPAVWLGAEGTWTYARLVAPISSNVDQLDVVSSFLLASPLCAAPCTDTFAQHAPALRVGASFEPVPAAFAWVKVGGVALIQRLSLAVDGSDWRWRPVIPELAAGVGLRAGDRFQVGLSGVAAARPSRTETSGPLMARVVATTGFRFGAVRYHE
jgi:hypothetical protein